MCCKKVLWFALIYMIKSVQLTENNTSSPVLFTLVGQALNFKDRLQTFSNSSEHSEYQKEF